MFTLYAKKNGKGNEIGFLEGVTRLDQKQPNGEVSMIPVLIIAWSSFDPATGEVGATHQASQAVTFESPADVVCLGTENTFFTKFDMYDDDTEGDDDDDDDTDLDTATAGQ